MVTALASGAGLTFTSLLGWPLRIALTMLIPWGAVLTQETVWTYRHYGWLALFFYVLAVTQTGHFFEHVAQMTQMHVLGLTGSQAQGVLGTLNHRMGALHLHHVGRRRGARPAVAL